MRHGFHGFPQIVDGMEHFALPSKVAEEWTQCFNRRTMLVVHVHVRVKPGFEEAFKEASLANARESVREPGIARFDVLQRADDAVRFVLVEVYRTPESPAAHKETAHYKTWRDRVAGMMAEPRSSAKFAAVLPDDAGW